MSNEEGKMDKNRDERIVITNNNPELRKIALDKNMKEAVSALGKARSFILFTIAPVGDNKSMSQVVGSIVSAPDVMQMGEALVKQIHVIAEEFVKAAMEDLKSG